MKRTYADLVDQTFDFPQEEFSTQKANLLWNGLDLKALVDEKAAIIQKWMDEGKIAQVHPYHLVFSIWALTQHYADFDVQVRAILGEEDPFEGAEPFIDTLYRKLLTP